MIKKLAATVAFTLALGFAAATPAQAQAEEGIANAVGLMIKYADGVSPISANGAISGENFAGVALSESHDIGVGFTAVSFKQPVTEAVAARVVENLKRDRRIERVAIDHDYSKTAQSVSQLSGTQLAIALGAVFKPAAAPLSVKVADSWTSAAPFTPRLKISWVAPKVLNGGKLAGFQVWRSVNGAPYALASTITNPKAVASYLSVGLTAGTPVRVYVKAITKLGTAVKFGLPSKPLTATPTTRPVAPSITGYSDGQLTKPKWNALSLVQRGGLPVTYLASATAPGKPTITCTTAATTCQLNSFSPDSDYVISVTATNSRGSSKSEGAVRSRDPYFYEQWYLYGTFGINAPKAWAQLPSTYQNQVVVAVVDTGIASHPDLDPQLVPGYDFVSLDQTSNDGDGWDADASDPGSYNSNPTSTSSWHGTHVAGIIGAAANGDGLVGVAPGVKLQSVRALGGSGGKSSDLVAAVTWASGGVVAGVPLNPTPAKVINISMGTSTPNACDIGLQTAFSAALSRGVSIVTSAGNGDTNNQPMAAIDSYPGNCFGSINVGATNSEGDAAYYSNFGLGVDISAPGGDDRVTTDTPADSNGMIISTFNAGSRAATTPSYAFDEGTSMAAPMVAGAVALLYAKSASMTPDLAWTLIRNGVRTFKPGSVCALTVATSLQRCGAGIVDVSESLKLVK